MGSPTAPRLCWLPWGVAISCFRAVIRLFLLIVVYCWRDRVVRSYCVVAATIAMSFTTFVVLVSPSREVSTGKTHSRLVFQAVKSRRESIVRSRKQNFATNKFSMDLVTKISKFGYVSKKSGFRNLVSD